MRDVAQAAEVSVQTVSRVLNGKDNVSSQTRDKVNAAIETLNYHRNIAALSLVTNNSLVIGVIDFSQAPTGSSEIIRSVQRAAYARDYFVSLAHVENLSAKGVRSVISSMLRQSVAGIVFVAPYYEALSTIDDLDLDTPFVVVAPDRKFNYPSVSLDGTAAARIAIDHLTALGHKRMVHLCGPLDWVDATVTMESWYKHIQAHSHPLFPTYVGDWTARSGYETTLKILAETNATAIFTANDQMALGAICAVNASGLRVPEDISIIGFGDLHDAEYFSPPLTTIKGNYDSVGEASIEVLIDVINGVPRNSISFGLELIERSSTAPPKS